MNIKSVKTSVKYGNFVLRGTGPNLIEIKYSESIPMSQLTSNIPRVYLIAVDGEIKKIGGSAQRGGIRGTMSFYTNARQGSPGKPRFILHHLIADELKSGHQVDLHVITSAGVAAKVPGLYDYSMLQVHAFKEMEQKCLQDFFDAEDRYPDWNFQENHDAYPDVYSQAHLHFHQERLNRRSTSL